MTVYMKETNLKEKDLWDLVCSVNRALAFTSGASLSWRLGNLCKIFPKNLM